MNHLTTALLVTAAALATTPAWAGTRVTLGIHVGLPVYAPPPVVVVPVPPPLPPPPVVVAAPPCGYWREVVVRTWVPERWVVAHDRWGRPVRNCTPGYFAYRTERVWVENRAVPAPTHHHGGYIAHHTRGPWGR